MLRKGRSISSQLPQRGVRTCCWLVAAWLVLLPTFASAELCTLYDASSRQQKELLAQLDGVAAIRHYTLEQHYGQQLAACQLVITLGSAAAERMAKHPGSVLHAMLRHEQLLRIYPQPSEWDRGAVYSDTPLSDYMSLIDVTMPDRRRILVFGSERTRPLYEPLSQAARRVGRQLEMITYRSDLPVDELLRRHAGEDAVLLILPDANVFNSDTARPMIMAAYQRAVPMVTYAPGLVRAGSLMAVYRAPADQAAELQRHISHWQQQGRLPNATHAPEYSVSINYQLARAMRLTIQAESLVLDAMRKVDNHE